MGSEFQQQEIVWDTGSDYFFSQVDFCTNCDGGATLFETANSSTFERSDPEVTDTIRYGDGTTLEGILSYDSVCFLDKVDACASSFPFFAIYD